MRVGTLLTIWMDAFARVLDDRRGRAEPPVGPHRQHRHAAAAVVRDQNVPVVFVEDEMARSRAHRRPLIQERQRAGRLIDRERADRSGRLALEVVDLVHGKQEPPLHIEVDERWIRRLDGQSERHERDVLGDLEILGLQPEEVDTLAPAPATCVRADIHERLIQSGPLYH